jgi:gamma-glutamylcyclotransferase (GGCT)/AIG2-like uncharacterized protein YtfP
MSEKYIRMFVNGQAMSGGVLNSALDGAMFLGEIKTAKRYRFYSFNDEFPGLYEDDKNGDSILGELYKVSYSQLRDKLLPNEPKELELSVIELEDGTGSLSLIVRDEPLETPNLINITHFKGWLAYLNNK